MKKMSSFNLRAITICALFFTATLLGYFSFAAPAIRGLSTRPNPASTSGWQAKVEASVLQAASTGETEFMINFPLADLSGAASLQTKAEKGNFVFARLTAAAEAAQPAVRQTLNSLGAQYRSFWVANVIWAKGNLGVVQAVAQIPQVAYISSPGSGGLKLPPQNQSASIHTATSPAETDSIEPNLIAVHADQVWAMGYSGQGAVVAGCDSGVHWTHAALKNHYRGWNGTTVNHDYNWHDGIHNVNPGCPGDSPEPCDDDLVLGGGHGSHTMGTMVGDDGGNNRTGMAPQAKWIACRNMNEGVGVPVTGYLECMQFMLAPTKIDGTAPDPTKAPDVINNSWGCVEPGCVTEPNPPVPGFLRATLQASRAAGIVYVVSAGNDGEGGTGDCSVLQFPLARYPESFTVASVSKTNGAVSSFSSRGPVLGDPDFPTGLRKPDIGAPGEDVRSSLRGSDTEYGELSGTSMAGPHVAGLVALIISANPHLAGNVDRIEQIIEQTAIPKTTTQGCGGDTNTSVPNNVYGWGNIDALAAVTEALKDATPVPIVSVVSRKTHGGAGTFDINLPLSDPIGVECRAGQPSAGEHTIVFTFANPLTNVTNASVDSGSGFVSSKMIGADPHQYVVKVSGATNAQKIRVSLIGVTDNAGNSSPTISVGMGVLLGDTSGNGLVNASDVSQTKAQSGAAVGTGNFREDVTVNGSINASDVSQVKTQSGTALP